MSLTRAIARNTAVQVAGKLAGVVFGLLTVAVMTRSLGAEGYGELTTALSFLQFFGILVDFGLTLTLIRMIADPKEDETRIASNVFTLRLVTAIAFFGLAPVLALAFPYPASIKTGIAVGSLSFFAMALSQLLTGIFQKHLAGERAAVADVAGRATLFALTLVAARSGGGLLSFLAAFVAGNALQFALSFGFARAFTPIRLAFDLPLWRRIVRESWPIGVSIAFNLVYLKGDVIILSLSRTQSEVGLYGAAYKVLDVVTIIPMVFMGLVLPLIAASWAAGRKEEFTRRIDRAFEFMTLLAVPLALGAWPVGADLMRFVAGEEFAASGAHLAVLMIAGAAVFWGGLFGHAVVALGLQKRMIAAYALDAALSIALYVALIPAYGAVAAAWVTVFSEAFIALLTAAAVIKASGHVPPLGIVARTLAAALVMTAAVQAMSPLHVLPRIVLGAAVYALAAVALGAVKKDTLSMLLRRPSSPSV